MSKIIQAINAMVSNPHNISHVMQGGDANEIYFMYRDKHKWSLVYNSTSDRYFLNFYPGRLSIDKLASMVPLDWESVPVVSYASNELRGREAADSMRELFTILREKLYGLDSVLDEIIADDEDLAF